MTGSVPPKSCVFYFATQDPLGLGLSLPTAGESCGDLAAALPAGKGPLPTRVVHQWREFLAADNRCKDQQLKLIAKVHDAPWVVKTAVENFAQLQPVLLGNKLRQNHFKGQNYYEVDIDIGSDPLATTLVGLCQGYSVNVVVDLVWLIQSDDNEYLPEVLLGVCRLCRPDMSDKACAQLHLHGSGG